MARIYIETTIPSFYYNARPEPEMVAMCNWTRQWWEKASVQHELVTSQAVYDELWNGIYPFQEDCLDLIQNLPKLIINSDVAQIIEFYLAHKFMPADPEGDVLHLALASYHRCEYLVTWNCRHLANPHKFGHLKRLNDIIKLEVPVLITPHGFLELGILS